MRELLDNPKEDQYLNEFRQKIAQEMQEDIERRRHELERSRNGLIGSIAGIVLAAVVSWFLLLPHFGGNADKEIPVIKRPILPVKIQPSEPGGMEILNQDKTVYALVEKNATLDTKVESLLPSPETPKMPVIEAKVEETETIDEISSQAETETSSPEQTPESISDLIESVQATATEKIKIPEKLRPIEVNIVKATTDDIQKAAAIQNNLPTQSQSETKPEAKLQPKEPDLVQKTTTSAPSNARFQIQLMALSKKEAVQKGYQQISLKHAHLKNLPYQIVQGPSDSLYRLMVGAFATKEEAQKLCDQIKKTGDSCMVKAK